MEIKEQPCDPVNSSKKPQRTVATLSCN